MSKLPTIKGNFETADTNRLIPSDISFQRAFSAKHEERSRIGRALKAQLYKEENRAIRAAASLLEPRSKPTALSLTDYISHQNQRK
jgi:hypothetical protein